MADVYAYNPEICDHDFCPQECDKCEKREAAEQANEEDWKSTKICALAFYASKINSCLEEPKEISLDDVKEFNRLIRELYPEENECKCECKSEKID